MNDRETPTFNGSPYWGWGIVLVGSIVASAIFSILGVTSPVLFGSLVGGMGYALTVRRALAIPRRTFQTGQALIGVTVGSLLDLETLKRLVQDAGSIMAVSVGTLVISVLAGFMLGMRRDVSLTTGAFSLVAGGASGIVALAHELGADDRVVSIVQYLRVLLVLFAMPLVTLFAFNTSASSETSSPALTPHPWTDAVFALASVVIGLSVARYSQLPAASLLASLVAAVGLSLSGLFGAVSMPPTLESAGYAIVGVQVGLRFTRARLASVANIIPSAAALIVAVILGCAGMGALLSLVSGIDPLTAYLATTPGGLYAVLAIAADSDADATYVLAVQVIRVFTMLLAAPVLARILSAGSTEGGSHP